MAELTNEVKSAALASDARTRRSRCLGRAGGTARGYLLAGERGRRRARLTVR